MGTGCWRGMACWSSWTSCLAGVALLDHERTRLGGTAYLLAVRVIRDGDSPEVA